VIIVIDALNRSEYPRIIADMHRLRARVFHGRLGWQVRIVDGEERDRFDQLDPAHIVSINERGEVVGCMRLLQTTGPHMLVDVFSSLLDGEPPLRSARLWEATRFCVDTDRLSHGRGPNSIASVTSEVMIGAFEYAMEAGVSDAVAVIDPVMDRVLKRSGNAPYDYLGTPKQIGKVVALAALMDCTDERVQRIREYSGIHHDVFLRDSDALELEAEMAA
jgi:N-acyl-L-homoserine lactone synthetase